MSIAEILSPQSAGVRAEHVPVVVIGAGQAGLSVGYHLARRGIRFVILDANERVGDAWRTRWDSLRLFTPSQFDGLDGMPFPAPAGSFPTKDAMADYLEDYADKFKLPLRMRTRVETLMRVDGRYIVVAGEKCFETEHVIVAMANYQTPRTPAFASELDPRIVQLHSNDYRNPTQLREGGVLIVGAGNSGAEIAHELAKNHRVWIAGNDVGEIPFDTQSFVGRRILAAIMLRGVFHRLLTLNTPMGRKARTKAHGAAPLIRVKSRQLEADGVARTPRVAGIQNGKLRLADGHVLDVSNVIWCTGFEPNFSWIKLPGFDAGSEPQHTRGVAPNEPGLYFVGLSFLYAMSSSMVHGVGRDAKYVVRTIADRLPAAAYETRQP